MKRRLSRTLLLAFSLLLPGEAEVSATGPWGFCQQALPRDTSFTLAQAAAKIRNRYPQAVPAVAGKVPGVIAIRGMVYSSVEGRDLHLDIFRPAERAGMPVPVILMFHGGGWRSGDRSMEHPMAERFAAAGYLAVTVEYRLSPEARYPAALADGREALRWIGTNAREYGADPERIALYGCSSGGHLAALLGVSDADPDTARSPVRAIVNVDGPVDLTHPSESGKDSARPSAAALWLGATYASRPGLWREASPAFRVTPQSPPIIFINSSEERYRAGRDRMVGDMQAMGIRTAIHVIPDSPHTFWLFHPWHEQVAAKAVEFLDSVLKPR